MTDTPGKRRLRSLKVTEISLVDRPANQHALISLAKRDGSMPGASRGQALVDLAKARCTSSITKLDVRTQASPSRADAVAGALAAGRDRALAVLRRAGQTIVQVGAEMVVAKMVEDQRFIAGWASVIAVDGKPVVDRHGDQIDEVDMVEAAHTFMRDARVGKVMHAGPDAIEVVESLCMTPSIAKAMGVECNRTGWWVAARVHDESAWARIKSGELRALSIGGTAVWCEEA